MAKTSTKGNNPPKAPPGAKNPSAPSRSPNRPPHRSGSGGKRSPAQGRKRTDFSLEDILSEFRSSQQGQDMPEIPEAWKEPEAAAFENAPAVESEAGLSARDWQRGAADLIYTPEDEETPAETAAESTEVRFGAAEEAAPAPEEKNTTETESAAPSPAETAEEAGPEETDGTDALPETEEADAAEESSEAEETPEGDLDEENDAEEADEEETENGEASLSEDNSYVYGARTARQSRSGKKKKNGKGGERSGVFRKLYGYFLGRYMAAAYRRQNRVRSEEEEPERPEMPPMEAARLYARQMPALAQRARLAAAVTILPLWIALGRCIGFPIPGALGRDGRAAAAVSMVALLCVMILGLDVFTAGVVSAFRGQPGAETLIALSCAASLADCLTVLLREADDMPLPYCAVCCVSLSLALLGSWFQCRGHSASFHALSHARNGWSVTGEKLLGRKDSFLVKSRKDPGQFLSRSEEGDACEKLCQNLAPFLMLIALLLSLFGCVKTKSFVFLPHELSLLTAVCAAWPALFALPGLYADLAMTLRRSGIALSGWSGAKSLGKCRHMIITDTDLFPEGTVALSSVNIVDGAFTDTVISNTGSILTAAETGLASVFLDLMERSGSGMKEVQDLSIGEGGVSALIDGVKVYVGCAGYMHLQGVKIQARFLGSEAIYTAFNRQLVGAFLMTYAPDPSVKVALHQLRKSRRRPIFACRDFNIDPKMIREKFDCEVDGFEFPDMQERYEISPSADEAKSPCAAVVSRGDLGQLAELFSRCRYLYRCGVLFCVLMTACAVLGLVLGFQLCWKQAWDAVSCVRVLLYMLLWTLPCVVAALDPVSLLPKRGEKNPEPEKKEA